MRILELMFILIGIALISGCIQTEEVASDEPIEPEGNTTTTTTTTSTTTTTLFVQTEKGASWDRTCWIENGRKKCNLALYSGIRNVYEDEEWKRVEDARSLKGRGFDIVYLENDSAFRMIINDFNLSFIDFDLNFTGNASNYPEFCSVKPGDIKCDFKTGVKETVCNETDCWKEETKFQYKYQNKNGVVKQDLKFNWKGNPLGKEFSFGGNSTTIKLQEADTENLADLRMYSTDDYYGISIKYNISSIPSGKVIDYAKACFGVAEVIDSPNTNVNISRINNQTWNESLNASEFNNFELTNEVNDSWIEGFGQDLCEGTVTNCSKLYDTFCEGSGQECCEVDLGCNWNGGCTGEVASDCNEDICGNDEECCNLLSECSWILGEPNCVDVTVLVNVDYELGNNYTSFFLEDPDYPFDNANTVGDNIGLEIGAMYGEHIRYNDKEDHFEGVGHKPYLNITYSEAEEDAVETILQMYLRRRQ